jgi:uncharacterized Zn-finger protein
MTPNDSTVPEKGALSRRTVAESATGNKASPAVPDPSTEGRGDGAAVAHAISMDGLGTIMSSGRLPKFQNDGAAMEIRIGTREFNCIGVSPPHDHPHVYINMGNADSILCPYCATRYRYDPRLGPFEADPHDSLFVEAVGGV